MATIAKKLNGRGSSGIGKPRNPRLGLAASRDLSLAIGGWWWWWWWWWLQVVVVVVGGGWLVPVPCQGEIDDEATLTAWQTQARTAPPLLWLLPRTAAGG